MTDAEAMAALSRGEIAALDALVVRHNDRAQRLAFGVLRDPSLTHDVVADSFLAAAASARLYDPGRPFQPWFDRIVVNRAIREARRKRRHRRLTATNCIVTLRRRESPAHSWRPWERANDR